MMISEALYALIKLTPQEKDATLELYRLANDQFIWLKNEETKVALLLLANAAEQGLKSNDYQSQWLSAQWDHLKTIPFPSLHQQALFDTTLTHNLLHYYSDVRYGRIKPSRANSKFTYSKDPIELAQKIWNAIQKSTLIQLGQQFEPTLSFYHNLKKALHNYQKAIKDFPKIAFKFKKPLKIGQKDPQVIKLRRLLITLADFVSIKEISLSVLNSQLYDKPLSEAIKRFQKRHRLKATGRVSKQTVRALNFPLTKRLEKIELGLERFRWVPRYDEDQLIFVNIPSFRLWAFNSLTDKKVKPLTIRVVVGKASRHKTPTFSSKMKYLVFRPYWGIPYSILKNEVFPGMKRDANYLTNRNMELIGNRVRQRPGSRNALGLVKFIFPNKYSIYLHDTPSKSLFRRTRRDFSHGCVRVSKPATLAAYLLKWKTSRVKRAMNRGSGGRRQNLEKEIPVILFYSTALALENSSVTFLNDVYGRDAKLIRLLKKKVKRI
ncbi:MAG: L,D-transpeptidase family protein [Methylococcales bacterium]|nr:L,D-transpeptidase family protein [Methylococcales bacterium]